MLLKDGSSTATLSQPGSLIRKSLSLACTIDVFRREARTGLREALQLQ